MITLCRHAQSTYNAFGDTTRDCPITDHGKQHASEISGNYDLIICSTLRRARQTLDASSLVYKNILFTDLCREIRDGNPINLLSGEDKAVDNENAEQISARVDNFLKLLREMSQKYNKILVISHGVFLGYLSGKNSYNCEQWTYMLQ